MNVFDPTLMQRRASIARGVLLLAFLVLFGAFFRVQIIEHDKFQLRAETNRLRPVPLTPPRGAILDWQGRVIAENVPGYTVKLLAPSVDSLKAVLKRLRTVLPMTDGEVNVIVARFRAARYQPALIARDADFATIAKLEEHRALLPGMVVQSEPKRKYGAGKAVAHVVGYVSEVTDADLEANRFPGAGLGSIVGKAGLERSYDSILRGTEGMRYVEVNARGGVVREDVSSAALAPTAGRTLNTTIDVDLQRYIDSIWPAGRRGAMVAMTPRGEIRALYSAPSYDPNQFVGGISGSDYDRLTSDSTKPLLNRAIIGRYPPASPFKLAIAAMALRRGLITLNTRMPVPCNGGYRLGNRVFKCWDKRGHGSLDLLGAVAKSCDVYFYQLGLRLGLDSILADGVSFGFKDRSGIDLPSEQAPIFPAGSEYYDKLYGPRNWSAPATTLNMSIGQGENTQTLINMLKFYAALAGSGDEVRPHLLATDSVTVIRNLGLSEDDLAALRRALVAVVQSGTARGGVSARLAGRELAIAGKTGTAQNSHGKDHGWFIGFAPADKPQLIVGGIMEFAEHGTAVVPYVTDVLTRYVLGPQGANAPKPKVRIDEDAVPAPPDSSPEPARDSARPAAPGRPATGRPR